VGGEGPFQEVKYIKIDQLGHGAPPQDLSAPNTDLNVGGGSALRLGEEAESQWAGGQAGPLTSSDGTVPKKKASTGSRGESTVGSFGSPKLEAKGYTSPTRKEVGVTGRQQLSTQRRFNAVLTAY